jgi:DNA modification methylase
VPNGRLATETIYCDDNLTRLASLPRESVDLIYLDPPFFSNRHYEVIWGDEAEIRSFEDRWEGGINVYIEWMRERMIELHKILKPTGTIYLHCDWHAGHYLKVMMDEVFGIKRFLNEIIWHYESASGAPQKWLHRNHQTILRYGKGKTSAVTWNAPRSPWPASTLKKWQKDEKGRIYHVQHVRETRYYADPKGKIADDVWDINFAPRTRERLGYPTQKPEALLDKIVEASSNQGDIVLDPFAGCGTALVSAHRFKRRWVGIDISPTAVNLMKRRMEMVGASNINLVNMPTTEADLRQLKPFEFQNWVIQRFNGTFAPRKSGDMGIDGRSFFHHYPIQVKQSDHVGRNVVDNFETAIKRDGQSAGYIVGFSFTRDAREEVARAKAQEQLALRLVTVSELLRAAPELSPAETGQLVEGLPLPAARPPDRRPSVEQLVESAQT